MKSVKVKAKVTDASLSSVPEARKVAYIATVYSHLAHFHLPFMKDLQERGYEVHAYAAYDACRSQVEEAGVRCFNLPFSRSPLSLGNLRALRELIHRFREEHYQLIHTHTPNAAMITRLAALYTGTRNIVYTAHGFHFFDGAPLTNWLLYYPMERVMSRWTDVLITLNHEDYGRAQRFPVRGKAVWLPGVGVELPEEAATDLEQSAQPYAADWGTNKEALVILCAAEFNRNKNQEQLILAAGQLVREGMPILLLLAGAGTREAYYRELVRQQGLESSVRFLGYRRDVSQMMNAVDVVALTSRREGLPKVLLEGLAAGRPLLVTNVRGSRELALEGENGFVVDIGDIAGTAEAIRMLCHDESLRRRMGMRSLQRSRDYALEPIRKQLGVLYEELMGPANCKTSSGDKGLERQDTADVSS